MGNEPSTHQLNDHERKNIYGASLICNLQRTRDRSVLMIGLDNAGKSSILSWANPNYFHKDISRDPQQSCSKIMPTIGLDQMNFQKYSINWNIWDMSGQGRYRNMWSYYFYNTHALIFTIDSHDHARIAVARDEFFSVISHSGIKQSNIPILIFLNKADVRSHKSSKKEDNNLEEVEENQEISARDIEQILKLDSLQGHIYKVQQCSGMTGGGIEEGFRWLAQNIRRLRPNT